MEISEIFYSIQGEGKWMGVPNIFIRTTGCNLRCPYCDTKYAYKNGKEMTILEILKEVKKYPCKKICITGGEPLLQKDIFDLIRKLTERDYESIIETNGSLDIQKLTEKNKTLVSLDIKCPSSNMSEKMNFENINKLSNKDQIKFILQDKKDYEFAKMIIKKYNPKCKIYFQTVWGNKIENIAKWILNDGIEVTLGIQLHKIIWKEKKGV